MLGYKPFYYMNYNYKEDTFTFHGCVYELREFRRWMFVHHPSVCASHLVKYIKKNGHLVPTYDWMHIYFLAEEYGLFDKYINQ